MASGRWRQRLVGLTLPWERLKWGVEAKLTYWLAREDCKRLIDRLRAL